MFNSQHHINQHDARHCYIERQVPIVTTKWFAELAATGRIDVIDITARELADLAAEKKLDEKETLSGLAFDYIDENYHRLIWD